MHRDNHIPSIEHIDNQNAKAELSKQPLKKSMLPGPTDLPNINPAQIRIQGQRHSSGKNEVTAVYPPS
ncbi:hypothetical protein KFK09_028338 [Dendrobium nobile]|uniref:Uncharacterized protein n=1 Tax=Dendrobium nobile TaxID=94219 RepID=A0A8T3A1P5_DENNO|nr:hypothetical protein KFK09_028338 [Dendrobium nobile]